MGQKTKIPKNFISETAATETLVRFFKDTPEDFIALEDIFKAAGRNDFPEETNKNWLNNKTNQLKHHKFVKSIQEFDKASRRHKVVGYSLTLAGKKAIGRVDSSTNEASTDGQSVDGTSASLDDVAKAVEKFQMNNPNFEVVFDVKFKGVQPAE
jgi:hypothetical protein